MAGRSSNHWKKQGADPNQPVPQEGAPFPATKTASPRASGSRCQGAGAKDGSPSTARPPSAGRAPKPTISTRTPGAQRSANPTSNGRRAESSRDGATRTAMPAGDANCRSKASGKAAGSKNQPSQKIQPSIAPHLEEITEQMAAEIEKETRGQRENPVWFERRKNRITASIAHRISRCKFVNGKSTEIPQSYLKSIVGLGCNFPTPAMQWGIQHEPIAIKKYQKLKSEDTGRQISVRPCGLFIDPTRTWLAASPDGVVVDKETRATLGLVEVKCPYKHRNHTIAQACNDRNFCLQRNNGEFQLKKNHAYFTQIQCQLAVLGLNKADLVVYTDREVAVIPVESDGEFWKDTVAIHPTHQNQTCC
ncbi:uncharacterized protein [Heptranchias perlo]|uniref:uncharacterized protein isoform X2 n=1 Tax=Heptranchias perlo TaxID=212740 RepID=UPI0035595229